MSAGEETAQREADVPPPGLGTWRGLYVFLVGELLVTVGLLYALARWAAA